MLPTPDYKLEKEGDVYSPAEDTFLLLDAIEQEMKFLRSTVNPKIVVEVGSGSGVVTTFIQQLLADIPFISLATDLNFYATRCTKRTAEINKVSETVDVVQCDLVSAITKRLQGNVDLLVFNPPYVPTEELAQNQSELCFAGGETGRCVLDRLMPHIPNLLSSQGVFYVIALKQNNVPEMLKKYANFLKGSIVLERWCGIEYLYVLKFQRIL